MTACLCNQYNDISDRDLLNKRSKETKKLTSDLTLLAVHAQKEHKLYKCPACDQLWQLSLDWMGGNKPYIFKVPNISETEWIIKPYVQPDELFNRIARIQLYLKDALFVETHDQCRKDECFNHAIKLSIFCAMHHMESIGIKTTLPNEFTWFDPYFKENYEFGIEQLKKLPNYKAFNG